MGTIDRAKAVVAVQGEMGVRGWTNADLARHADIDPGTAGDFLNGRRWPKAPTLGKIESALDWRPGTLVAIATGVAGAPTVSADDHTEGDDFLYRRPDELSDAQWEALQRETRAWIDWQVARAARER